MKFTDMLKVITVPVIAASLCCLSPLILVLLGLANVSFAAALTDTFYGEYKWAFRALGLLLLSITLYVYWVKRHGVCTLDLAKRQRREIINSILLTLILGTLGYMFFLYIIVHYLGVWLNVWI